MRETGSRQQRDVRLLPPRQATPMRWRRFLLLIDPALVLVLALMATTDQTVVLFHLIFVLLGVGALFWSLPGFALRGVFWVAVALTDVLRAVDGGRTQPEELSEIPLLALLVIVVFTIASRQRREALAAEAVLHEHAETQAALADFARLALATGDTTRLLDEATRLARLALHAGRAALIERLDGDRLAVRSVAGTAMSTDAVDLPLERGSLAARVIAGDAPVVVSDWATETRFGQPARILGSVIRSTIAAPVKIGDLPYGALAAHGLTPRQFRQDDQDTLSAIAHTLGMALSRHQAVEALAESELRFSAAFHASPAMLALFAGGTIVEANAAFARTVGGTVDELVGQTAEDLRIGPEELATLQATLARDGRVRDVELTVRALDGSPRRALVSTERIPTPDGTRRTLVTAIDVTARVEAEETLRATVDGSLDAIVVMELDGTILRWNPRAEEIFGWRQDEVVGRELAEIIVPPTLRGAHRAGLERLRAGASSRLVGQRMEVDAVHRDGRVFPVELSIVTFTVGGRQVFSGFIRDISAAVRQREQLEHLALNDPLTGLPNRTLLRDRLELGLAAARRSGTKIALALLDIDQFKRVNDSLGHPTGDRLLVQLARRLRSVMRVTDTLARLGGDDFAAIFEDVRDPSEALALAQRLRGALAEPFDLDGRALHVSGSVGVVLDMPGADTDTMLRYAEIAMYAAKRSTGIALYGPDLDPYGAADMELAADLYEALAAGGLRLVYQPVVEARSRKCRRVEALARWDHLRRGPISPAQFIPIAERWSLIERLGAWVLESAIAQAAQWQDEGIDIGVSVNVSLRELYQSEFVEGVARLLSAAGLPPERLSLEITETAVLGEPSLIIAALHRLRGLGVRLAIDDFGTGYASLAYLERLPIDEVKVDRSFVSPATRDPSRSAIVRATIELAHTLGLGVVGEGVEDEDTWRLLSELGCDEVQGFWIGRPQEPGPFPSWLSAWAAANTGEGGSAPIAAS